MTPAKDLEQKVQDITKSYLPLMAVAGLLFVAFQTGSTYNNFSANTSATEARFAAMKEEQKNALIPIVESIKNLAASVDKIQMSVTDPTARALPADLVRWTDMYVFCLEIERGQPTFKCPLRARRD